MTHPVLHSAACDLFGVRYPIVQTGMGWVAGARLTSATSAAGGLGILASATMTYQQLEHTIHEVQGRTDRLNRPLPVHRRAAGRADLGSDRIPPLLAVGIRDGRQ